MSTTGLSKSRLERMHHVLSGYVERQEMPEIAYTAKGIQRLLDAGVWDNGVGSWFEVLTYSIIRCILQYNAFDGGVSRGF